MPAYFFFQILEGLFVDAEFTTDVVNRSVAFFFFEGFNDLTRGVSAFFHLTGEISVFYRILSSPNFSATYRRG